MYGNNEQRFFIDNSYRIESQLGSGGSGNAYKAWHMRMQKYVVIKEIHGGLAVDKELVRNEVEALKNVKNPYLPQIYDFHSGRNYAYTVMELIEGDSFDCLLKLGRKFTETEVLKWYRQLASALETLHNKGICHRDIKPSNIMLTPNGDVCLIDFNVAFVDGNDIKYISRSQGYASPEQCEVFELAKSRKELLSKKEKSGYRNDLVGYADAVHQYFAESRLLAENNETELCLDAIIHPGQLSEGMRSSQPFSSLPQTAGGIDWKRSDIYSLGATIFHILTGESPQDNESSCGEMLRNVIVAKGLRFIINKSLQKEPSKRFSSGAELADSLRRFTLKKRAVGIKLSASVALLLCATVGLSSAMALNAMARNQKKR